jgi:hypothetical protein
MIVEAMSVVDYEAQVKRFKPKNGRATMNSNDLRRFIYEWFTHFEHAAPTDFYLAHLADENLDVRFPGLDPLTSHTDFAGWYANLMAQTAWNFHDISAIQIEQIAASKYLVTFLFNWYGEVRTDSDQLARFQSQPESRLYHHFIRQTWTVNTVGDRPVIQKLVGESGDSPSPISE